MSDDLTFLETNTMESLLLMYIQTHKQRTKVLVEHRKIFTRRKNSTVQLQSI